MSKKQPKSSSYQKGKVLIDAKVEESKSINNNDEHHESDKDTKPEIADCGIYEPLNHEKAEFRLLRLHKGRDGEIKCDLFKSPFYEPDRTHKYIAQSYTWGKSPRTKWIKVNDKRIRVANSLFDALAAFRRIEDDVILWVDALCINQADNKEKSHQITRMTEVYRNAEEVFVFLGRDSPHLTRPVMSEMKKADEQSSYPQMKHYLKMLDWKNIKDGLKDLLNREWFKRVWILQEVAFARTLRIFCGSQSVSATCFVEAAKAADIDVKPHCRAIFEIMPRQHQPSPMGSQEQITSSWWSPEKTTLADLLKLFGNREATQACDKVYALLSMSCDAHDTDYLRPEYGKPDAEVVYDTAVFVVGYRGKATTLAVFQDWNHQRLADNIDNLSRIAAEWAMDTQHTHLVSDVLQLYKIQYDRWGDADKLTQRLLRLAVDTRNLDLLRILLGLHDAQYSKSCVGFVQSASHRSEFHNLALELSVKANSPEMVQEVLRYADTKDIPADDKFLRNTARWAVEASRVDILHTMSQRHKAEKIISHCQQDLLALAVRLGNVPLLKWALPDFKYSIRNEMIRQAIDREDEEIVHLLLNHATDMDGQLFERLIGWSTSVSAPRETLRQLLICRWAELFCASWTEHHVESILQQGANPDGGPNCRRTPLIKATGLKMVNMVAFLLRHKVDVNARYFDTPLLKMITECQRKKEDWEKAARPNRYPYSYGKRYANICDTYSQLMYTPSSSEKEPLDLTTETRIIELLLAHNADPNIGRSFGGCLALHTSILVGSTDLTQSLLRSNANPNAIDSHDGQQRFPLHMAVTAGSNELTELLLDWKANPNMRYRGQPYLLHLALQAGYWKIAKLLIQRGANVNARDPKYFTPLFYTCTPDADALEISRLLLKYGAEIDARDREEMTPLIHAAHFGVTEIVTLLLQNGAASGAKDKGGYTPLLHAKYKQHKEVSRVIQTHEAFLNWVLERVEL